MENQIVFISYSWDNEEHKEWVLNIAGKLRNDGIDVILDRYNLRAGGNLPFFVEDSIKKSNKILLILTPNYKLKADNRLGGVGQEYSIINNELLKNIVNNRRIIPILRGGTKELSIPEILQQYLYIDFSSDSIFNTKYEDLVREIYNEPDIKIPKLGSRPDFNKKTSEETCTISFFRPYQKNFRWIDFEVFLNGKFVGNVRSNGISKFKVQKGKHILKIKYDFEKPNPNIRSISLDHFAGESDERTIRLEQAEAKYECGYEKIETTLLGLLTMNAGHKIYIKDIT